MKSVIFDLDGTLADTSRDLIEAANVALARHGCGARLDHRTDALTAFKGGRAMLRAGFAKAGLPVDRQWIEHDGYQSFLKDYEDGLSVHTVLFSGVLNALDALAAAGWRLGVCTNKPERLARLLLSDIGIKDRFSSLVGADTLPVRKPHPEPLLRTITETGAIRSRSVLVGDTDIDLRAGRAAGVPVILIGFGPQGSAVERLAPDARLDSYSDLPALAEGLCFEGAVC